MTRYERRMWFERLLDLQNAYTLEAHQATSMTVAKAIEFGERLLAAASTPMQRSAIADDAPASGESTHHR